MSVKNMLLLVEVSLNNQPCCNLKLYYRLLLLVVRGIFLRNWSNSNQDQNKLLLIQNQQGTISKCVYIGTGL
jgi:hypothetical protein